jgi:hypothetical protein
VDDAALLDYVCTATLHLLDLLQVRLEDERVSEPFIEGTMREGRMISILQHPNQTVPFTRLRNDAVFPSFELHLPRLLDKESAQAVPPECGLDLNDTLVHFNIKDPRSYPHRSEDDFLPDHRELPRPALAVNKGPIYVRIIEILSEPSSGFVVEGPHPIIDTLQDYLFHHANHPSHHDFSLSLIKHRLGEGVYALRISNSSSQYFVSPLVIIALLENELGFQRVGDPVAVGGKLVWMFQRAKPFRLRRR